MIKSDTIIELAKALSAFQGELHPAKRESVNPFFKMRYADLASVWEVCRVPLAKNGLSLSQIPQQEGERLQLITLLLHTSGEYLASEMDINPIKSDPQSVGSAITYARRYAMGAMLGIATEEDDDAEAAMARGKKTESKGELIKTVETVAREALEGKAMAAEQPHVCKEHGVKFFKSGKMTSYAHPMGQPEEKLPWCHEHKAPAPEETETANGPTESDQAFEALKSAAKPEGGLAPTFRTYGEVAAECAKLGVRAADVFALASTRSGKPVLSWPDVGTKDAAWALVQELAKTKKEATPHGN